jgi:hypothetical protein
VKILSVRFFSIVLVGLVLAAILTSAIGLAAVRADVGVRPVLPGGSNIQPGDQTPVQMVSELVTMTVRGAKADDNASIKLNPDAYGYEIHPIWFEAVADVQADFTMHNPTEADVSLIAWFPLASALGNVDWNFNPNEIVPRIANFRIKSNGTPIEFQVSELPNPGGSDKPDLPWASFPLDFPAGKDNIIHVSYTVPLSPAAKGSEVALYYVFQTGSGWAGPIGLADLVVNLPYPATAETIADDPKISLPFGGIGQISTGLPKGVVVNGNQARWSWTNFEPEPEDDFAIWLLKPGVWEDLQAARDAVKSDPGSGKAWLSLAMTYHSLSALPFSNAAQLFSPFFLPQAVEAYQKAAALLPDHPAPHTGLGLLALARIPGKGATISRAAIQRAQYELKLAQTLEAANPALAKEGSFDSLDLADALSMLNYNDATATVDAATLRAHFSTRTAQATIDYKTIEVWKISKGDTYSCWPTAAMECTAQAIQSETIQPSIERTSPMNLTLTPIPTGGSDPVITITLGGFVILGCITAGFLIYLIYLKEVRPKKKP